jgi:hypothetical protein
VIEVQRAQRPLGRRRLVTTPDLPMNEGPFM